MQYNYVHFCLLINQCTAWDALVGTWCRFQIRSLFLFENTFQTLSYRCSFVFISLFFFIDIWHYTCKLYYIPYVRVALLYLNPFYVIYLIITFYFYIILSIVWRCIPLLFCFVAWFFFHITVHLSFVLLVVKHWFLFWSALQVNFITTNQNSLEWKCESQGLIFSIILRNSASKLCEI